jgi:hypothetical protein
MRLLTAVARALVVAAAIVVGGVVAGVVVGTIASVTVHGAVESRQQAESLARKITLITQQGATESKAGDSKVGDSKVVLRRTEVTQDELNSWFTFRGRQYLPVGVSNPTVTMIGNGSMRGAATLDLETIGKKRSKDGGMLDLWSYLGGKVPVTVTGTLRAHDGRGKFDMESAQVAGVPVPKALLQELVSLYASSPSQPNGVSLDDSFELPARIRSIDVGRGQLVVVQ